MSATAYEEKLYLGDIGVGLRNVVKGRVCEEPAIDQNQGWQFPLGLGDQVQKD